MAKSAQNTFDESETEPSGSGKISGMLLLFCTIISIAVTNSFFGSTYIQIWQKELDFVIISKSIEHWINDGLMAIFFLLVGLEIKRELVKGVLSNVKSAMLPVISALGGVIFPALIFLFFNKGTEYTRGWAIPAATDIAFSLGILSLLGSRVPFAIKIFLTALAIIDDLIAIIIIALFYTSTIDVSYLIFAAVILTTLSLLNKSNFKNLSVYYLLGVLLWFFVLKSGVHATIAGVLLAFTIPTPFIEKIEHRLFKPVTFLILPLFALANTAIPIDMEIIKGLSTPLSLGIIFGLFLGKVIGITTFSLAAAKLKLSSIPKNVTIRQIIAVGFIAGIGFTMSIFISNLSFNDILIINESKLAVLLGSLISAVTGILVFLSTKKNAEE
ncbi:MAG TPA: Na+/H+ antiporter NhaA [Ignavibacteria bacterium]|nr:Na+/H+ antiporter NhaA [Ignavibacteria bacterium]